MRHSPTSEVQTDHPSRPHTLYRLPARQHKDTMRAPHHSPTGHVSTPTPTGTAAASARPHPLSIWLAALAFAAASVLAMLYGMRMLAGVAIHPWEVTATVLTLALLLGGLCGVAMQRALRAVPSLPVPAPTEHADILAALPVVMFTEREGRIGLISVELEQWMGWPQGSGQGRPVSDLVGGEAAWHALQARLYGAPRAGGVAGLEWPLLRIEAAPLTVRLVGRHLPTRAGACGGGTVWTVQDVSAEIEQQRMREIERLRAEEGDRTKRRFLNHTCQQLRAPMNAMLDHLDDLTRNRGTDEAHAPHPQLSRLSASAQSLAARLSDLLDLCTLEQGGLLLIEDFHLGHLVDRVDARFRPLAQQRGLVLEVHMGAGCDTWISGDVKRMRQVITHCLHSALDHAQSGALELTLCRNAANQLRIEVRCEGPGLGEAGTLTDTPLALAVCRDLVRLMQGEAGLIRMPNAGMTLWVELPLTLAVRTPAAQTHAGSALRQSLTGLRVLVLHVGEQAQAMASLTLRLKRWGMHVEPVGDAAQAVRRAMTARDGGRPFDLALVDLHLPLMHGAEAVRWLRREGLDAACLPVIALTQTAASATEREQALRAGASACLAQPVAADELRSCIIDLLPRSSTAA